jgi:hypothetical protein
LSSEFNIIEKTVYFCDENASLNGICNNSAQILFTKTQLRKNLNDAKPRCYLIRRDSGKNLGDC